MDYIAGQITCRECGYVEMLIKAARGHWARVRRCADCGSKHTAVPVWWPVEDTKAIAAVMSAEFTREAIAWQRRRGMH